MALQITEFSSNPLDSGIRVPVVMLPPLATQNIAVGGASANSASLNAATRIVRLVADQNCRIEIAASPTALSTSLALVAGSVEYFGVPATPAVKIAVIAA